MWLSNQKFQWPLQANSKVMLQETTTRKTSVEREVISVAFKHLYLCAIETCIFKTQTEINSFIPPTSIYYETPLKPFCIQFSYFFSFSFFYFVVEARKIDEIWKYVSINDTNRQNGVYFVELPTSHYTRFSKRIRMSILNLSLTDDRKSTIKICNFLVQMEIFSWLAYFVSIV